MAGNVVLAIGHPEFAVKLADYLREEEPEWDIAVFTGTASLARAFNGARPVDLLIGESELLQAAGPLCAKARRVVELVGQGRGVGKNRAGVGLYQPLPALLAAFRAAWRGSGEAVSRECAVVGVFSAAGGAGKTTLALNMLRQAGERGLRAFYLNLEPLNATARLFGNGEPDSLSRLLYGLQAHPETWLAEFDRVCRHQPRLRADYVDAPDNPAERLALTTATLETLIEGLRASGRYDLIVVDPDSGCGDWHRRLAELCDRAVWLATADPLSLTKADMLARHWRTLSEGLADKLLLALNRSGGSGNPARERESPDGGPAAKLPYVPQWKLCDQPWNLLGSPAFAGAVDSLLDRLGFAGRREETEFGRLGSERGGRFGPDEAVGRFGTNEGAGRFGRGEARADHGAQGVVGGGVR